MATAGGIRGSGPERAFVFPLPATGTVRLDPEEGRHLVRVRRVEVGDPVVLFDGNGETRLSRLVDAAASGPTLEIVGPYPDREPSRAVAVAAALPGAGRADEMIAALAELGVTRFLPLACERGNVDPFDLMKRRGERFERLVREAAKVNGRARCLRIDPPQTLAEVAAAPGEGWKAVLLDPDPALPRLATTLLGLASPVLLIGPEGGWTPAELAAVRSQGTLSASLWECALTTEVAAVAAAALALGLPSGVPRSGTP